MKKNHITVIILSNNSYFGQKKYTYMIFICLNPTGNFKYSKIVYDNIFKWNVNIIFWNKMTINYLLTNNVDL